MIFLLNNWKPIVFVLAVLVVYGYGYRQGNNDLQREWDAAISRQYKNNLEVNEHVSKEYQKKIADLRKRYDALRLRTASGLQVPNTTSRSDAETSADGLHGCMAETIGYSLMFQGDIQAQQLIYLQDWIRTISK